MVNQVTIWQHQPQELHSPFLVQLSIWLVYANTVTTYCARMHMLLFYNFGIIAGTVILYPIYGLPGIGIGVLAGALAHLLIHIPVLAHERLLPTLRVPSMHILWSVIRDSVPRSLALAIGLLSRR